MSVKVLDTRKGYSEAATYSVFLLLTLFFRPSMLYVLAEPAFVLIFAIIAGYLIVGKQMFATRRKVAFGAMGFLFFGYITLQSFAFGTARFGVVLREMGFMMAPATAMFMVNRKTWPSALKALMTPVFVFLPSYLISGILTVLLGSYEPLAVSQFILDMGDDTYLAVWAFPYSLYIGGKKEFAEIFVFHRATGFVREPGIYQVLLIITYFGVDILKFKYRKFLKGALLANIFLTFSTAGWGAFGASWLYYNVFASEKRQEEAQSQKRGTLWQRLGALLLSVPLFYFILFAETQASVSEKLAGSSGQVRVVKGLIALREFIGSPVWGVGFRSPEVTSIHFIGVLAEVGIVGVTIIALLTFGPVWGLIKKFHPVLVFLVPLVLTTLLAQPLFGKTIYFLIIVLVASYPLEAYKQKK
jgi:hypothetical protein